MPSLFLTPTLNSLSSFERVPKFSRNIFSWLYVPMILVVYVKVLAADIRHQGFRSTVDGCQQKNDFRSVIVRCMLPFWRHISVHRKTRTWVQGVSQSMMCVMTDLFDCASALSDNKITYAIRIFALDDEMPKECAPATFSLAYPASNLHVSSCFGVFIIR